MTNEKQLLARAGLTEVDRIVAAATPDADALRAVVDEVRAACAAALHRARSEPAT